MTVDLVVPNNRSRTSLSMIPSQLFCPIFPFTIAVGNYGVLQDGALPSMTAVKGWRRMRGARNVN